MSGTSDEWIGPGHDGEDPPPTRTASPPFRESPPGAAAPPPHHLLDQATDAPRSSTDRVERRPPADRHFSNAGGSRRRNCFSFASIHPPVAKLARTHAPQKVCKHDPQASRAATCAELAIGRGITRAARSRPLLRRSRPRGADRRALPRWPPPAAHPYGRNREGSGPPLQAATAPQRLSRGAA